MFVLCLNALFDIPQSYENKNNRMKNFFEDDEIAIIPKYYDLFKEAFKTININNASKKNISKGMKGFISWSENTILKVDFKVDKSIKKKRHRL